MACPQCGSGSGRKLDRDRLLALAEPETDAEFRAVAEFSEKYPEPCLMRSARS